MKRYKLTINKRVVRVETNDILTKKDKLVIKQRCINGMSLQRVNLNMFRIHYHKEMIYKTIFIPKAPKIFNGELRKNKTKF